MCAAGIAAFLERDLDIAAEAHILDILVSSS
jgi:hypothetical protein